ncbi:MAG: alpha-mannosidase, partial [Turicibacter sp.]
MEFNNDYNLRKLNDIRSIKGMLANRIDTVISNLNIKVHVTKEPLCFEQFKALNDEDFKTLNINDSWAKLFECGWFIIEGQLDPAVLNQNLILKLDINGEALLFNESGKAVKGFTNGSSVYDRQHGEPGKLYFEINEFIKPDGSIKLFIDGAANDLFGSLQENGKIKYCEIVTRNQALLEAYYDVETLVLLLMTFEENSKEYSELLEELFDLFAAVAYETDDYLDQVKVLSNKYLNAKPDESFTFSGIGHAHIDLAWLWPVRESKRKGARTFSNVFYLLEKYPNFKFGVSQPQLLEWIETEYPDVFEKVKEYVKLGRIEVQGGMWVESDTNVTGEESLVRQMLYGKHYWRDKFDVDVQSVWLPDVFGYNAAMPQIIKKSGMDYFMTIKLSWSLINVFPYHTFNWRGIDNSDVLVHMPPEGNYNSSATVKVVKDAKKNYKEQEISNQALLLFGIGDGGGGPADEHMERINRNNKIQSSPKIEIESSADFFEKLAKNKDKYPNWKGELYLENHRGTYTSQANVKYYNRMLENKLKMTELLLVQLERSDFKHQLDEIWKEVLLYQFHDILPGSSIKRVYDECLDRYEILNQKIDEIINEASNQNLVTQYDENSTIYNPLKTASTVKTKVDSKMVVTQINPQSTTIISKEVKEGQNLPFNQIIETPLLRVEFDKTGFIKSIIDKELNKEIVKHGLANKLNVYKDFGNGWDIRDDYRKQTPKTFELISQSYTVYEDIHELTNEYVFGNSKLTEVVTIDATSKYIEFSHDIDWQSMNYMLRSEFPLVVNT